jgi:hypothetical protein
MPSQFVLYAWVVGVLLEVCFLACSIFRGAFLRYFFLNFYVILSLFADLVRQYVLHYYGFTSTEYMYVYYYSDLLLTLSLFVAVISLASRIFAELKFAGYVRWIAVLLLLGTAGFSYAVIAQSSDRLSTRFAYELSQNLYFVGLVLTYILWGAVLKLHETRTRVVQMILSLGLYFSAYAGTYALINLGSKHEVVVVQYLAPVLGCFLPVSWMLTILRHNEDSRLTPARLVAVPR